VHKRNPKNTDKLYLKLAETLFDSNQKKKNGQVWDHVWDTELPLLRLCYMIDDYEELFEQNTVPSNHR
jgi:hypothetical protein